MFELNDKKIIELLDRAILDDGYTDYDKVSDDYKEELTVALMNHYDNESDFLLEYDFDNISAKIKTYITNSSTDNALDVADAIKETALKYYDDVLDDLFEKRKSDIEIERKEEAGLRPIIDKVNGEVRWVR